MTQGETLEELEENRKDAFRETAWDEVRQSDPATSDPSSMS
jgi:predicted RNase H-like HicB family nuclease